MIFKDKIKYALSRFLGKRTVLFSQKPEWREGIVQHLEKKYQPFFYPFDTVDVERFDFIVPLDLASQHYLNSHPELAIHKKSIIPSERSMALCDDKLQFAQQMKASGLGSLVPRVERHFDFPYVLKKRHGTWGLDIFIIKDEKDETQYADKRASNEYFQQEYIPGQLEYSAHVIIFDGRIVWFNVLEFEFGEHYFIKGKFASIQQIEPVDHHQFIGTIESILNAVNYQGLCAINYKVIDGEIKVFEVNPRYGAYTHRYINSVLQIYEDIESRIFFSAGNL